MKPGKPLERRTALKVSPAKVRAFEQRGRVASASRSKPRAVSPASPEQRRAVKGHPCIVCGSQDQVDPAHIIDRSLCPSGADSALAVVALCRQDHRDYDEGRLDLLPHLEPHHREELAHAVYQFGLISTLERVTNERWCPAGKRAE